MVKVRLDQKATTATAYAWLVVKPKEESSDSAILVSALNARVRIRNAQLRSIIGQAFQCHPSRPAEDA